MYQNGGKNFWIHNTGPLGCLPEILATIGQNYIGDNDNYGCLQSLNNAAKKFNEQLYTLCEELRSEMKDATIVHVDMYSIKYGVITNPSIYGRIYTTCLSSYVTLTGFDCDSCVLI